MTNETRICPLCGSTSKRFFFSKKKRFFLCPNCKGIHQDSALFYEREKEEERYRTHNNDVYDEKYRAFVSPITEAVQRDYSENHIGLDFGAGTGPVITKVLEEKGYKLNLYDPFFHPYEDNLKQKYDFIVSCEVIEHFHHPLKEFKLLQSLLKHGGKLYCMTDIYNDEIDFKNWYYKNDPTHVFLYQKETFLWIQENIPFRNMTIQKRLITFEA